MQAIQALRLQNPQSGLHTARNALNRLLRPKPVFALHNVHSPQRRALEAYIGQQFECAYGATITEYLPQLFSMQCQGRFSAVAGIRTALDGDLFVEKYLDEPVEQLLSQLSPTIISRSNIVEIGNLVSTHRGACQLFFTLHATVLYEAGFTWGVFAATDQVERIIRKLNFATFDLGGADPARLGQDAAQWGHYYDTSPTVRAVDLAATVARFRRSPLSAAVITFFSDTIAELARSIRIRAFQ
jgi:hypothetical protein